MEPQAVGLLPGQWHQGLLGTPRTQMTTQGAALQNHNSELVKCEEGEGMCVAGGSQLWAALALA